jgi:Glucosyl transferase GtrII
MLAMSKTRKGLWLWLGLLCVIPLAVYWQTVFHEYGFRDDYSLLREAHEEPFKLYRITTANGRPIYGAALAASLRPLRFVGDLPWLRLLAVGLLAAVAVLLWRQLRRSGWSDVEAGAIALGVALLPGAQITVGWAIAWPIALALLFAVVGFSFVESGLQRDGGRRLTALLGGGAFYFLAGLTYQSNALFAIVPLAAVLLLRDDRERLSHVRWVAIHIGTLFASLFAAFLLIQFFFDEGVVMEAARMRLEPEPLTKLLWFVRQPLVNSLALFELRDRFNTTAFFWIVATCFGVLLSLGYFYGAQTRSRRLRWLFCLLCLPFVAHAVSLAASSQAVGYRTVFGLSGLVLVLVVFALRSVVATHKLRPWLETAALASLFGFAALSAQRNAYELIAEPQAREWGLIESAAKKLRLDADTDVYIIRPAIEDRSTEQIFDDEFGSLSSDADWASREMFKAAMRERFPEHLPSGSSLSIVTGPTPPTAPSAYDEVVDLRKLRQEGDRLLSPSAGEATTASRR